MTMQTVESKIKAQPFDKLKVNKISSTEAFEILSISLEKDALFPEHTSPKDAVLIVIEGQIEFHINNISHKLQAQEQLQFSKETAHWVKAVRNSKFLIIR